MTNEKRGELLKQLIERLKELKGDQDKLERFYLKTDSVKLNNVYWIDDEGEDVLIYSNRFSECLEHSDLAVSILEQLRIYDS